MKGAERIYKIVRMAISLRLNGVINESNGYGFATLRRGNIALIAGQHARGNTCRVFIENGSEKLEVYGIIAGTPGWTEEYGWIRTGKWVDAVEKLLTELEEEISNVVNGTRIKEQQHRSEVAKVEEEKLERFNSLFK